MIRRVSTWIAFLAALAALAGCGGGGGDSDTSSPQNAARAYAQASNDRDFERLCNVLSDDYKMQLHMGSRCVGFLQEQTLGAGRISLAVARVNEQGDQALAVLTGTIETKTGTAQSHLQVQLQKAGGEWHVTHLGGNVDY
jgi:hypothetical protein